MFWKRNIWKSGLVDGFIALGKAAGNSAPRQTGEEKAALRMQQKEFERRLREVERRWKIRFFARGDNKAPPDAPDGHDIVWEATRKGRRHRRWAGGRIVGNVSSLAGKELALEAVLDFISRHESRTGP